MVFVHMNVYGCLEALVCVILKKINIIFIPIYLSSYQNFQRI